ncbi:MAG: MarR family transcriptional regulator [Candidatus Eisenbacteria bacterium]
MTSVQLFCLNTMAFEKADTATTIAGKAHLSPSTVVGILDRLEDKKLITRSRDAHDRRVVRVSLTDAGTELVRTTPHPVQDLIEQKFDGLTLAGANRIASSLESLVDMLGGEETDPEGPLGELSDDADETYCQTGTDPYCEAGGQESSCREK